MAKSKSQPQDSATPKTEADLLKKAKDDFQAWMDYTNGKRTQWENFWKLYDNIRVKRNYQGSADTFDPMVFQMVETGVDNVYGSRPKVNFVAKLEHQEKDTKILTGLWDNTWDENNLDNAIIPLGRETKVVGNSAAWAEPADGYMKIEHIPWQDNIFDPNAVDDGSLAYGGYRKLIMLDEAKKIMRFDPTAGEKDENGQPKGAWVKRYKNLSKVKTWNKDGASKTAKEIAECYAGSTLNDTGKTNQIEITRLYYRDKMIEMANRDQIIFEGDNEWTVPARKVKIPLYEAEDQEIPEDIPNTPEDMEAYLAAQGDGATEKEVDVPELGPVIPVALNRRYVKKQLLIAKGDVEAYGDTQEHLNDVLNAKMDEIAYATMFNPVVDVSNPQNSGVKTQLANRRPGDVIEAHGGANAVGSLTKPQSSSLADNEVNRAKQSIRDTARIDQVIQGVSAAGDKTATEINAQVAQASGGFTTEVRNLETGFYSRLGYLFIIYLQAFVTTDQVVRVLGPQGAAWETYKADKYWGPYDCKVMLDTRAKAKEQKEAEDARELYGAFKDDQAINQIELKKKVLERGFHMDEDDIKLLLLNPSPVNMATAEGLPAGDVGAGTANPQAALPAPGVSNVIG